MSQSDWETDSEYRQFRPGRYAMRQLGRSVSRRTKLLLQPTNKDLELEQDGEHGDAAAAAAAAYRRGPPLPSGIHRRSVSFDNLPMFPDSVRRSSTEPGLSTEHTSPLIGLPAASTWNSGTATTKSGKSPRSTYSHGGVARRAWLPGLAHPLSTGIHIESSMQPQPQLAVATGGLSVRHVNRESFSGAAQLDASTHMSNSPHSPLHGSDPFQNRHLWISEEDLALEAQDAPAHHVTFQAVQIATSVPVGSEVLRGSSQGSQAAGGTRKLGNIARVISNISRKLHRMRSQRSASQPATPAEVRQSILDSARQNMIHVPNDPAHDFYRFFVNPADPVSDRESSTGDSPTISRHASSGRTRRQRPHPSALAASGEADMGGGGLPPVGPTSPVFSSESLDRLYESISRAPSGTPIGSSAPSHRRSASDGAALSSIRPFQTNQGHNGSVSELVLAKLESEFVDNVRVSTRLAMDLSAESSYGTFVRFHNSGELSGIFAADRAIKQPAPAMQQGPDSLESPPLPAPEADAGRYARNHDNIRRFVDEVRAVRQDSDQRKAEALGQQLVLDNNQALLDAALHIYERQQRLAAEAAPPIRSRRHRQRSQDPEPSRRAAIFGMFCVPTAGSASPPSTIGAQAEAADSARPRQQQQQQLQRSQSFPRMASAQPALDSIGEQRAERISYPLQVAEPPAAPRTRSGFLAAMLGKLSTASSTSHARRKSNASPEVASGETDDGSAWHMRARRTRRRRTMADAVEAASPDADSSQQAPAPNADGAEQAPALNVDLSVPAESLSDEICAGIAHNAQDATLSSSGRRMYSEVLQSLRDPPAAEPAKAPAAPTAPARRDTNGWRDSAITGFLTQTSAGASAKDRSTLPNVEALQTQPGLGIRLPPAQHVAGDEGGDDAHVLEPSPHKHVVRFEQKAAAPARTSSLAMDTITAATSRQAASSSRHTPQSMPQSRAMSSDDSLADMLASDASGYFRSYRMGDLAGLESYASTPLPTNPRLRRLEDEVLYGASRPTTGDSLDRSARTGAMLSSFDSPASDAGTGRTQILDFAEAANIRSPAIASATPLQRRPSARPEIRDVRGILWTDTNPTSTAAASTDLASVAVVADTPATLNSPERPATANASAQKLESEILAKCSTVPTPAPNLAGPHLTLPTTTTTTSSQPSAAVPVDEAKLPLDDPALHNPLVLARLVHTSPDPRSLIYDAASQFGSMRSRPSFGSDPKPKPDSILNAYSVPESILPALSSSKPDPVVCAPVLHAPALESSRQMSSKLDCEWPGTRTPDELSLHRRSRLFATDSDALAQVSVQATMSGESPAIAAKTLSQTPYTRAHAPSNGTNSSKRGERPISLQEYVEQQKVGVHHRTTPTGHEQLNFRVSLLERRLPEHNRKARSVSLPSPHSGLPALPTDILQPVISRSLQDRPIFISRPAAHQRTRSFYDSPHLVQTLLQPEWPIAASAQSQSQEQSLADEELAERALFSHLLGDGAALTSPDLKVARRQSGALPAPPLFDPDVDTGENGVPDSVLRAYLGGDLTAIERFFEHIMRITAPSSIYDGDISEDGDWTFGLEGPPPEVLAQREAARKDLANASREVPDMLDASADASRVAAPDASLQLVPDANEPALTSTAPVSQPDPQASTSVGASIAARAVALSEMPTPSPAPEALVDNNDNDDKAVGNETPASNDAGGASRPVRRIAVARSQLARTKREGLHTHSSGPSSSSNSADLSGHNCKTNTSISLTNSQRPADDESRVQATEEPGSPWDDVDIAAAPSQTPNVDSVARLAMPSTRPTLAETKQPTAQYDKLAACISPGRARSRNHRHSESGARSSIIPSLEPPSGRHEERQMLMARLRVLETMIQKAAIEESRLQPPAVLRKSRLVEDVESIASIYSSSMEMDYERIYQELNSSQRPRADHRRKSADPEALRRSSESARHRGLATNQSSNLGSRHIPQGTARGEVLARLKQNSHARTMLPLRASMLGRAPIYRPDEQPAGASSGGVANASVLSEISEVAYSARSSGSIRIDIVDESSAPSLPATNASHIGRALVYQNSSRFRRTAKLLGS